MKPSAKLKNNSLPWRADLRVRANDVVEHRGSYFQNTSGINTEPLTGNNVNWIHIGSVLPDIQDALKLMKKADGNVHPFIEPGDIVSGVLADGVTGVPLGKYLGNINGGALENIDNFITNPIEF